MVVVAIKRMDFTATSLRAAAVCADDPGVARRALAIAMVIDEYPLATAAELAGMDRQTLRDWVHRFNAEGLEGLSVCPRPGRPAFLSAEQIKQVEAWVEAGPDLKADSVVRWRRIDLVERIKANFSLTLDVCTVADCYARSTSVGYPSARNTMRVTKRRKKRFKRSFLNELPPLFRSRHTTSRWKSGGRMKRGSGNKGR